MLQPASPKRDAGDDNLTAGASPPAKSHLVEPTQKQKSFGSFLQKRTSLIFFC
jgi:hypothetical protein